MAESHAIDKTQRKPESTMNIATRRFTISTIAVATCAAAALIAAEPAQARTDIPLQRIEIVGQRAVPLQRIVIIGQRRAEPAVQRIVIVGQRQRAEHMALATQKAPAL
jgi:hypothetical protein